MSKYRDDWLRDSDGRSIPGGTDVLLLNVLDACNGAKCAHVPVKYRVPGGFESTYEVASAIEEHLAAKFGPTYRAVVLAYKRKPL